MNSAKLNRSERLQRVYKALKQRPMTTMEIIQNAGVCAVSSIISEIRLNGIEIACRQMGRGVYQYSLKDWEDMND